ncbi:unnamed protein product [Discosporangium mesarthrocarpum]
MSTKYAPRLTLKASITVLHLCILPGSLGILTGMCAGMYWFMYDITGEEKWKLQAKFLTQGLRGAQFEDDQDLGFQVLNSYGLGLKLIPTNNWWERKVLTAAETLDRLRWMEDVGGYYAWKSPKRRPEWERAINIDMIMNMEILLQADIWSGQSLYTEKAISHADRTWTDLVKDDYGTWHVADYTNYTTAGIIDKGTYQGYSDDSTWSRGQAWAVYGFAMFYRITQEPRYLDYAQKTLGYFMDNLPADMVAYADFDAPVEGQCKDSSANAIVASALIDLTVTTRDLSFAEMAESLLEPLLTAEYLVNPVTSTYESILMKGCREWGDVELGTITGDYFFLEALLRYKNLYTAAPVSPHYH